MAIKAIETRYKGYRFRSRLEARWAVFFDALGLRWEYEREGFDLDGTWYLPDFYLPQQRYYLEIKPNKGSLNDWPEHPAFGKLPNFHLIVGEPWYDLEYMGWPDHAFGYNVYVDTDYQFRWCECPDCHRIELHFEGRSDRMSCKECYACRLIREGRWHWNDNSCPKHGSSLLDGGCPRHGSNLDKHRTTHTERLMMAYSAAHSARFEHGESGYRRKGLPWNEWGNVEHGELPY